MTACIACDCVYVLHYYVRVLYYNDLEYILCLNYMPECMETVEGIIY